MGITVERGGAAPHSAAPIRVTPPIKILVERKVERDRWRSCGVEEGGA